MNQDSFNIFCIGVIDNFAPQTVLIAILSRNPRSLNIGQQHYSLFIKHFHKTMSTDTPKNEQQAAEKDADAIHGFFRRPIFLSFTIGIPFCIFKLLFGIIAIRTGAPENVFLMGAGWLVIIWASADLVMNTGRSALDLFHRPAPFEYCTIAQAGRVFHKPMVFLAIDTLITFSIICAMLWSGWITKLTLFESYLWYSATTMNLISLSLVSVYHEIRTPDTGQY
jgi:cation transport ATPase